MYQDYEELVRIGNVHFTIEIEAEGTWVTQRLPPEEVVESAAARVRPLLLNDEDSYHQNALKALGWMLRDIDDDEVNRVLNGLKKGWSEFDSKGRTAQAYTVQRQSIDAPEPTPSLADNVLAFAWIYGDVVHADRERIAETEQHGVRERYRAAAPLVCRLIVQTAATLHVIEWMMEKGLISLPCRIFEQDVVVVDPIFRDKAEVYMAAGGTEMPPPDLLAKLGPEWLRLEARENDTAGSTSAERSDADGEPTTGSTND
ncbi:hypothetical protein [Antrihabitans spumae]|uniref:Uncharacterized protein n=1 Tax=Antrihabitans spumae TaxID=3373370 RepID=A0ABW7JYI3_9NOCA